MLMLGKQMDSDADNTVSRLAMSHQNVLDVTGQRRDVAARTQSRPLFPFFRLPVPC